MLQSSSYRHVASIGIVIGLLCTVGDALAQTSATSGSSATASDALVMGDWRFQPNLELRTQTEYRNRPFDTGGAEVPANFSTVPTQDVNDIVDDQWWALSRARLGLSAERGPLRAVVELQDARAWGDPSPARLDTRNSLPTTEARQAFFEVRGSGQRASFFRLGRQEIVWGDGRLLGASDWSPTGRTLDAVRGQWTLGDFDLEGFASVLIAPGAMPPEVQRGAGTDPEGAGAQLHGLKLAWHIAPLLHLESNNLVRIVRQPTDDLIEPSDLYVVGLRVWGEYPGLSYALEGAYELGRTAVIEATRDRRAYAAAARARWEPGLPWNLAFGIAGAYASGQADGDENITRFDPVLPDVRMGLGAMGLYAWSNLIEGAGLVHASPWEDTEITLGYRYVAMPRPGDAWQTAALAPVGRAAGNEDAALGQELDASFKFTPWAPVDFVAGYGAFLTGEGGKNVLESSGRGRPDMQHYGYLQLTMRAP